MNCFYWSWPLAFAWIHPGEGAGADPRVGTLLAYAPSPPPIPLSPDPGSVLGPGHLAVIALGPNQNDEFILLVLAPGYILGRRGVLPGPVADRSRQQVLGKWP
jgi:hypothetical protein